MLVETRPSQPTSASYTAVGINSSLTDQRNNRLMRPIRLVDFTATEISHIDHGVADRFQALGIEFLGRRESIQLSQRPARIADPVDLARQLTIAAIVRVRKLDIGQNQFVY